MSELDALKEVFESFGQSIDEKEIIRKAMTLRGCNQTSLAHDLGYAYQSGVASLMRSKSLSVDNFVMVMNQLGFDVVVVDHKDKKSGAKWTVAGKIDKPRQPIPGATGKKRKGIKNEDGESE